VARYYLENFGCRATQADGAAIERQLATLGFASSTVETAQFAVLNTCTVTSAADADARAAVRRIHRENPDCKILVTGCYAQRAPVEIASLPGVEWVVGNSHKAHIAEFLEQSAVSSQRSAANFVPLAGIGNVSQYVGNIFAHTELLAAPVFETSVRDAKTRPNLKVQDGCDNRCSFCVIPFVRGQSRSLKLDSVLREVDALVAAGYKEIVVSGINLGRWGRDFEDGSRFETLMRALLEQTTVERIRISSVEPMDWSDELIALVAESPRVCKHAHVPLQSGSDYVLRMMHRKYRPWHYAEKVEKIRAAMPDAAIGADVMVGFPGETEALFEESRHFIAELPFTYLHVFTYSSRPGTAAAAMPDHVPMPVAKERNRILRTIAAQKNAAFRESFVGKTLDAVTLTKNVDGTTEALTGNYLKLHLRGDLPANEVIAAEITAITSDALLGEALVRV
jgi:threonylcarbamoyladenosine tRNA methylthiotransferase MtaB